AFQVAGAKEAHDAGPKNCQIKRAGAALPHIRLLYQHSGSCRWALMIMARSRIDRAFVETPRVPPTRKVIPAPPRRCGNLLDLFANTAGTRIGSAIGVMRIQGVDRPL